ncbi:uncharacterized protein LOC124932132 [Impatiens glandulifera]|uniref:uncharacterized protein LOC124932132 n=1 Tax=Impatiens glandulifera TaxID=253017 RepID=UPI001FB1813B|nr:uncharacterized protein LOC124932132 [Impatiens glandulifera]
MANLLLVFFFFLLLSSLSLAPPPDHDQTLTTILFGTIGRSTYAFDIYTLPLQSPFSPTKSQELRITDGVSINYNGYFPASSNTSSLPSLNLVYVSERFGSATIFLDKVHYHGGGGLHNRVQVQLVGGLTNSLKDRPSLVGEYLVYVSTHENPGVPRKSWNAVYSTHIPTGSTRRLSPYGVADFSPAVSPNGVWTAVASSGEKGWNGELEDLNTGIYVFMTKDGSFRVKVVDHGGWPCWGDDSTLYYHRKSDDGWWSVYRATLKTSKLGFDAVAAVETERVTPPGVHAFTPAVSISDKNLVVVSTRRPSSEYRHIELFDLTTKAFVSVTEHVSPHTHHFNPFISSDSKWIGYHRCRGGDKTKTGKDLVVLEPIQSPLPKTSAIRVGGVFPVSSPEGDRIAYVNMPGLYVINNDGSNKREITSSFAFSLAWDPKRKGTLYTNIGPSLANVSTDVHVVSIDVDDPNLTMKILTTGGKNNAFPSPSPDGKWIVFRSGRTGYKNLYIMDAENGEKGSLFKLTSGPWTDTMCHWSPDGEWIAFMSNKDNPNSRTFKIYMIHPNGTGLREVVESGSTSGLASHPWFSPDSKSIVFTSDLAGVSAEPISVPNQFDPFGDIFTIGIDGSHLTRLTHNAYGDGTPTWASKFIRPHNNGVVVAKNNGSPCNFDDILWLNKYPNKTNVVSSKFTMQVPCG